MVGIKFCPCKTEALATVNLLVMELHHRIGLDVRHVDQATLFDALRVFPQHQPPHVGIQEAPVRVVRVAVRFRVLVVDPVIAHPVVDGVLAGDRVAAR